MSLELRVVGGALDGQLARYDRDSILIGRDPRADVRLDPQRDRDVSARHAEIRRREGRWVLRDLNSTNGTFLNGRRLQGEVALRDGDHIGCGAGGPVLAVALVGESHLAAEDELRTLERAILQAPNGGAARHSGEVRRRSPLHARLPFVVGAATLAFALGAAWLVAQRRADERLAEMNAMLRRADSLRVATEESAALLSGRLAGLDSALATERQRAASLLGALRDAQSSGRPAARSIARELDEAARRQAQLATLAGFDYARVAARNQRAVALVAVEMADGSSSSGTAFSVNGRGLLVTNRHVVRDDAGRPPRRIAVKFSDTDRWLPARVVRVDDGAELATLQPDGEGPFPAVQGVAAPGTAATAGSPVALIGYPLGMDTPMDRAGGDFIARASLFGGMVSKTTDGVVQIDAYAGHGSSGSPVFDRRGAVVGVVFGGLREGDGRVVLAVSADRLQALLPESQLARVR
jgi:S1-C subfamily serine protease